MIVRRLFYNIRQGSIHEIRQSEGPSCASRLSLRAGPSGAYPLHQRRKRSVFHPGDGPPSQLYYSHLGRETAGSLLPVYVDDGGVRVS
jgi:hypothetical protein